MVVHIHTDAVVAAHIVVVRGRGHHVLGSGCIRRRESRFEQRVLARLGAVVPRSGT